jgi:cobalt/nickel transport system permease protein
MPAEPHDACGRAERAQASSARPARGQSAKAMCYNLINRDASARLRRPARLCRKAQFPHAPVRSALYMHIPDSVLSPSTSAATAVAMAPIWAIAGRRARHNLGARQVPLLALGAAFCFTVMMFNLPALGGTTAHPVAGTLLAVLLGPWAATIGVSTALAVQALLFGDGGILAYGANCFTMGFVLPFVGYSVYRLLSARLSANSTARAVCAGIGAYVGLNAAAAIVAVLLGIQPALFHDAAHRPLYFPFGLRITLPAMLGTHLLVAGPAEAAVTLLAVRAVQAMGIDLYGVQKGRPGAARTRTEAVWVGLLAMVALTPLGLLAKGSAWGEWDSDELQHQIKRQTGSDYLPRGFAEQDRNSYRGIRGLQDYGSERGAYAYLLAASVGTGAIIATLLVAGRILGRREKRAASIPAGLPAAKGDGIVGVIAADSGGFVIENGEARAVSLPLWMRRTSPIAMPPASGRAGNRFVERTLEEFAHSANTAMLAERWARRVGLLQRLDARGKIAGLFLLILVAGLTGRPLVLLLLFGWTVALTMVSRLPVGRTLLRVWLTAPLFVAVVAAPAALRWVTPGPVALMLWRHPAVAITWPGLQIVGVLLLRVGVAVGLAALLTLTTPWQQLVSGLRGLGVPAIFVSVLLLCYRYVQLLLRAAEERFVARACRTVGVVGNRQGRAFAAGGIAALFGRTLALTEEVYDAMVARGYDGEIRSVRSARWSALDTAWMVLTIVLSAAALGGRHGIR